MVQTLQQLTQCYLRQVRFIRKVQDAAFLDTDYITDKLTGTLVIISVNKWKHDHEEW